MAQVRSRSPSMGIVLGVLMVASGALAEEQRGQTPSLRLLEYLGTLVETEEGLIGPEDMGLDDDPAPMVAPDETVVGEIDGEEDE